MVAAEIWTTEWYDWSRQQGDAIHPLEDISDSWESISDRLCETAGAIDRDYAESIGEDIAAIFRMQHKDGHFGALTPFSYDLLFNYCKLGFWPCGIHWYVARRRTLPALARNVK